ELLCAVWPEFVGDVSSFLSEVLFKPSSSSSGNVLKHIDVVDSLSALFPENYETLSKHLFGLLSSEKTSDELQAELIDLLGFEQFEMVCKILEWRPQLVDELTSVRLRASKLSKYASEKVILFFVTA
uniref:CUE domain-containing protein n=1 Tax=Angiostrongylus cantonensis TaxID=6313 RepID=A0A0K0DLR2_ANGCA